VILSPASQSQRVSRTPANRYITIAPGGLAAPTDTFAEKPALLLLDLMRPKLHGLQVCQLLKTICRARTAGAHPSRATSSNMSPSRQPLPVQIQAHLLERLHRLFDPVHDADAETIHKLRVASRRLRVGLRCFASLFRNDDLVRIQRDLRRTTRVLGNIRTLDVNIQLLRRAPVSPARTKLIRSLLAERVVRVDEFRNWMATQRAGHLELRIKTLVIRARKSDAEKLRQDASREVNHLRDALRKRFRNFRDRRSRQAFHKMRIAAKRYRYALESCQAIFPVKAGARIRAVERLQDLMGACHDVEALLVFLNHADKKLAREVGRMIEFFVKQHDRQFREFRAYLREERSWLKRIKLQLPRD
jgi:CHAD domain-containing protein